MDQWSRHLLEKTEFGIVIINENGIIIEVNESFKKIIGTKNNLLDSNFYETFLRLFAVNSEEIKYNFSKKLKLNGKVLRITNHPMNDKGTLVFVEDVTKKESLIRSIDESNQLNNLLESVINSSYDAIFVTDANANGLIMNEAYTRITGVTRDELVGENMNDLIEGGIISESVTLKVHREKRPLTIVQNVKGKELLVTGNPVYDKRGRITHVVCNLRDISDLNRLKAELHETKALTKKYLDEIENFKHKEGARLLLEGVVAQSKEIIEVLRSAKKVSQVNSAVLLLGKSGVGKEVISNTIHLSSPRATKPYVKINCGAIPKQLLESELFGYEKGAFTGANQHGKLGYFEQAEGGTIFLDEVGEIPLDLQVKLLRVLQEYEIMRVGGTKSIKIDVRVISATSRDLEELVDKGDFRQDLFYRLNVVPINIPTLKERKADIAPLAYYFLSKKNEKNGMNKRFLPEVIETFEEYHWPGNIREMENLIERLVVMTDQAEIRIADLPASFSKKETLTTGNTLKGAVEDIERKMIKKAMGDNKTTRKAAKKLGISQSAVVKKMKRLKI